MKSRKQKQKITVVAKCHKCKKKKTFTNDTPLNYTPYCDKCFVPLFIDKVITDAMPKTSTIEKDLNGLFKIMPKAKITPTQTIKDIKYECNLKKLKITPDQHDALFKPIKKLFGSRLIERYSHETGHFVIHVKP